MELLNLMQPPLHQCLKNIMQQESIWSTNEYHFRILFLAATYCKSSDPITKENNQSERL